MSTKNQIKAAFEEGERLTVRSTYRSYGTFELKHYVMLLRKAGMQIVDEWKSNDRKRWKVYWLAR